MRLLLRYRNGYSLIEWKIEFRKLAETTDREDLRMAPISSTVIALELGIRMREAREQVGLSGVNAARSLGVSQNYLSDVERGKRKLTESTLAAAVPAYEIPVAEQEELAALRKKGEQRGWWSKYSGLFVPDVLRYFGLEHGAESIQMHENLLIPGLLQTEAYAHAIAVSDSPNVRTSDADRRVEARMLRQRRLTDDDPLRLTVVLSEGALKQQVGGAGVLAEQLRHVIAMIEECWAALAVFVVPFTSGAHGALGASTFHLLTFPTPQLPVLAWQENLTSTGLIDNPLRVNQYSQTYELAGKQAVERKGSLDLIHRELKAIT